MSYESEEDRVLYRNAFLKLKPICVALLPLLQVKTGTASQLRKLLKSLRECLQSIPVALLQKGQLASYAFYPLSQLLQINSLPILNAYQSVLEDIFLTIRVLVDSGALSREILLQVWLVAILVLGGPIESSLVSSPKTKRAESHQWSEECSLATCSALQAVLHQAVPSHNKTVEVAPTSLFSPPNASKSTSDNIPNPVLAHTLTSLLDQAQEAQLSSLRLKSLQGLSTLIKDYMNPERTEIDLLVQFLPGTVSALCKIVTGKEQKKKQIAGEKVDVLVLVLECLNRMVLGALGDVRCREVLDLQAELKPRVVSLEDFASFPTNATKEAAPSATPQTGKVQKTPAWLRATSQQIHLALTSILPMLKNHLSAQVREAFVILAAALLKQCNQTLQPSTTTLLLEELLFATEDEWPQVSSRSTLQLIALLQDNPSLTTEVAQLLQTTLTSLPQSILSFGDDEVKLSNSLKLLTACASTLSVTPSRSMYQFQGAERWSWTLLRGIEFARLPGFDSTQTSTAQAWIKHTSILTIENGKQNKGIVPFPALAMSRIPSLTTQVQLSGALQALARAFATSQDQAAVLIEHFLGIATGGFSPSLQASAWWMVSVLLQGLGEGQETERRYEKIAKSVVKAIVHMVDQEEDDDYSDAGPDSAQTEQQEALIPVERTKGSTAVAHLLDEYGRGPNASNAADNTRKDRASQHVVSTCLALRALAACANLLGASFRSELLSTLYPVLAHLSDSSHLALREHAEVCLVHIAFHSGYPSPQNLVSDNIDYIVNAVSQRLVVSRLDPRAPTVLISSIRLVGSSIVPLIQDVVDDIFDGLDNYHGYDLFCSRLLAVLDTLMKAMQETEVIPPKATDVPNQPYPDPKPASDVQDFLLWYSNRNAPDPADEELDPFDGKASAEAFRATAASREGLAEHDMDAANEGEEEKPPATRSQATCAAILSKAVYFLSHSSSFLRARVLSLIASGVPILGGNSRQSDLLPLINKAWPIILNRLRDSEPVVVQEAAALVEVLSRYVGDFVCRRVLDDAWPTFQALLKHQDVKNAHSALAGRSPFTQSHRLHMSVLATMTYVIANVPLRENVEWEFGTTFARFLASSLDPALQNTAVGLFHALQRVNPEAVWLLLSSVGAAQGTPLAFLNATNAGDFQHNIGILLDRPK